MAARAPRVVNAAIELGFVAGAGVLGFAGAPFWCAPLLALAMIAYWAFNRRAGLEQLRQRGAAALAGAVVISLALISAILAGAFWAGAFVSGRPL